MSHGGGDAPAPQDLLDEYWFFCNTLNVSKKKPPPPLPSSSRSSPSTSTTKPQRQGLLGCQRKLLLRTPSLPTPRASSSYAPVVEEQAASPEVDEDDLNWSAIYEGVLRTRIAAQEGGGGGGSSSRPSSLALQRAPSMPVDDDGRRKLQKEMPRPSNNNNKLRHSYSTLERHCTPSCSNKQHQTPRSSGLKQKQQQKTMMMSTTTMVRSKSALLHRAADEKQKKWKSSSDLESIEVQGFKDLGFVFDKEELREDLADVLPGLKNATSHAHGAVRRPYLSEAWHHDRRPPALIRVQSDQARSAAEMKDQLRMWAQAVACNVRQECA